MWSARPLPKSVTCHNCEWLSERNARLIVLARKTAIGAHAAGQHPRRTWDACNLEPCLSVKKQLDAMKASRRTEELASAAVAPRSLGEPT